VSKSDGNVIWTFQARAKVDSSPVVAGDRVVCGADDGRLYVVSLAEGRELWSQDLGQPVTASPAVAGGRIVVGVEDGLVYCFGAE